MLRILNIFIIASLMSASLVSGSTGRIPWSKNPMVGIAAVEGDTRIQLVHDSIDFWNKTFTDLNLSFKLCEVRSLSMPDVNHQLKTMSNEQLTDKGTLSFPPFLENIDADLVVILTDSDLISFTERWPLKNRALVVIRSDALLPLARPNVSRNVIAHELGHAVGLGHNSDEATLMCGRPAECRPDLFYSLASNFFPLTDEDKAELMRMYPPEKNRQLSQGTD